MSRKKIKQDAAQIEGAPLQSTADAQGQAPASSHELLQNIADKLGVANEQRTKGNKDRQDGSLLMRSQTPTMTF